MTLRALTVADWPQAEPLYLALTRSGAVAGQAAFRAVLTHPGTQVIGRFEDGRLLSMATLHILPNLTFGGRPYALIDNVVTDEGARLRGHGRAVLERALTLAREARCYKVTLMTGKARGARGFYEAVGFDAENTWGMTVRF